MLCAAAATEISTQLSKTPLILEQQRRIPCNNSDSSDGDQDETTVRVKTVLIICLVGRKIVDYMFGMHFLRNLTFSLFVFSDSPVF